MLTDHTRAALVDAAKDLNKVLELDPGIDVKLGVSELRDLVAEAATMVRDGDKIAPETRKIVDDLLGKAGGTKEPEGEKTPKETKATAKPVGDGKTRSSKFVPVDRDSEYGALLAVALTGNQTVAEVAGAVDSTEKDVLSSLKAGRRNVGIGFAVGADGVLSISLPEGVDAETVWAKAKAKKVALASARSTNGATRRRTAKDTGKEPKPASEFRPIRAGTIRERIVARMNGKMTTADIARELSLDPGNAHAHIYCLWRDCGLGFSYDAEQRVSVLLPKGVAAKDVIKAVA